MIRDFAILLLVALVFVPHAYCAGCPSTCGPPGKVRKECTDKPDCKLVSCTYSKPGRGTLKGKSCVPGSNPINGACPNRCIDPVWAEEKCKNLANCEVVACDRNVKGTKRPGSKCAPKPAVGNCPNRCIDPVWAKDKCDMLSNCMVVPCDRDVNGTKRPGGQCVPKPTACPNRCIDPVWAMKKCAMLSGCMVVSCDRNVNGQKRPGGSCVDALSEDECPDNCIDPVWAMKQCAMLSGCEVQPCVRDVRGTGTLRNWAKCTKKQ